MPNDLVAIDISHWQPEPDFEKVAASGIVGVILKATEGQTNIDATFRRRYDAALAAGLAVSSYHFMRPGNIVGQMNNYLNTVKPRQGERVCLDHEDSLVSLADLESAVEYLMGDSRDLQITIYSGHVIKEQLGGRRSDILADNTSLWIAQYSSSPTWPTATWPTWSLWQYTDGATVDGITGAVDGDRFNGSADNCRRWFGPAGEAPAPEARIVSISIDAPDDVTVQIAVNGELL